MNALPINNHLSDTRQALKESEERFHLMADALPVMIWALDAAGKSTYYNKQAMDFIGHTEEELIDGKCWQSVIHAYDILLTTAVVGDTILHQQPCGEVKYDFNYSLRQNSHTQNTREVRFPK